MRSTRRARSSAAPLEQVYVYEAPVRLWHWVMMVAIIVLAVTGYLIGACRRPFAARPPSLFFG